MYTPKAIIFLEKTLGKEALEDLNKTEFYKKKSNTVIDPEEIRVALQIVPRTILSFLQKELGAMNEGEGKEIKIPINEEAYLQVTKIANDVYSGEIRQKGEIVSTFNSRSLPSVGLVILTAFELYDFSEFDQAKQSESLIDSELIQRLVDEKLRIRDLVGQVIDQKLSERQAIDELVNMRLSQMLLESRMLESKEEKQEILVEDKPKKHPLKLKIFLDNHLKKHAQHNIQIEKSESVNCPDCGNKIFDASGFSGCVCFGLDRKRKLHLTKNENGVKISFSKSWDTENIQMLLDILREKAHRSGENRDE